MNNKDLIKNTVNYFVSSKILFTSVDISNEIKKTGVWIKNKEVSNQLKKIFNNKNLDYIISEIKVKRTEDLKEVTALLYHPIKTLKSDYTNIKEKAMSPDEILKSVSSKKIKYKHTFKNKLKILSDKNSKIDKVEDEKKRVYSVFNFL